MLRKGVLAATLAVGMTAVLSAPASAATVPGTLISAEPVTDLDPSLAAIGAREWRVTYASRSGVDNRPVVVSGMVIEPAGAAPKSGWPVVAYAHGTTGVGDDCAPSSTSNLLGQLVLVLPLVQRGYLVTATDYEGLGTPGPHPYLSPTAEGRSVIDSVRAARDLLPSTSTRWTAYGVSQGGQAVWAADQLARSWGRGLDYLGAAGDSSALDITAVATMVPDQLTPPDLGLYPEILYGLKVQHPQLRYSDYLSGDALTYAPLLGTTCAAVEKFQGLPLADFKPRSTAAVRQLQRYLQENALPQRRASGPQFVAQGTADNVVLPAWNDEAIARACRLGDVVQYTKYEGTGHVGSPQARLDAQAWLADRFAGRPAPDNCP